MRRLHHILVVPIPLAVAALLLGSVTLLAQAPPDTTDAATKKAIARARAAAAVQQPARKETGVATVAQLPASTAAKVQIAREAQSAGRFGDATKAYDAALADLGGDDAAARAQISLAYAQTLERWTDTTKTGIAPPPDRLARAEALYRASIATGTPAQQGLARNNLGTLQLRQGKYDAAVETLQAIDPDAAPSERFAYDYNLGRALELSGRRPEAFDHYLQSMRQEASFGPARTAAVALLLDSKTPMGKDAGRLGDLLLAQGRPEATSDLAHTLLSKGPAGDVPLLLGLLMRSYIAQSIDLGRFEKIEVPFLDGLEKEGRANGLARDIDVAMLDPGLKPVVRAYQRGAVFKAWGSERDPADFAALLKYAGDLYARTGNFGQALARYATAWTFDHANGEPAVYCALTIRDHPEVDRNHLVLNALIEGIFAEKGDFIRAEDWPNSLRMHLVLGSIFEQLGQWGPESNSHTVAFQYQAALADERRILATDKTFSRSPGLYAKLAECYLKLDRPADARAQFVQAAKAFAASGRKDAAAEMEARAAMVSSYHANDH